MTDSEKSLKNLSNEYNLQLILLPSGSSQEAEKAKEDFEYRIFSQMCEDSRNSKIVLSVLFREITDCIEDVLRNAQEFEMLIHTYETIGPSLSNRACELLKLTSIKNLPKDQTIDILKNIARLYSLGIFSDMGDFQLINWSTFCHNLKHLKEKNFLIWEVVFSDLDALNKRVTKKCVECIETESLLFKKVRTY